MNDTKYHKIIREFYFLMEQAYNEGSLSLYLSFYIFGDLLHNEKYLELYQKIKGLDIFSLTYEDEIFENTIQTEYPLLLKNIKKALKEFNILETKTFYMLNDMKKYTKSIIESVDESVLLSNKKEILNENIDMLSILLKLNFNNEKRLQYIKNKKKESIKEAVILFKNKLKQLKEKEQEEQKLKQNGIIKNKYPHIFGNDIAYTIFNEYLSKGKLTKANYSFLYRKMFDEELINETVKVSGYISFLNTHLNIDIDKIKTIHQIGSREDKEIIYYQIKEKYIKKN